LVELLSRYSNIPKLPQLPRNTTRTAQTDASRVHAIRRRLPAETTQQLLTDYQAGLPSTQLAKRYGISKGAVLRLLREYNIPIRRHPMTAGEIEEAIQLYGAGHSLVTISTKLGHDHGTIHRALRQAGVAMRDSHGRERGLSKLPTPVLGLVEVRTGSAAGT